MSMKWRIGSIAVALIALTFSAEAQPQAGKGDDAKTKRIAYVVQSGSAKNLATLLAKHFKTDVEIQMGPDAAANVLLINTSAAVFDEVLATLAKLDRKPHSVALEVFVIDVEPKKGAEGKLVPGDKEIDEKEFVGPAERVTASIVAQQKKGVFAGVKRYQLTVVENQPANLLNQEHKPYVIGFVFSGKGAGGNMAMRTTVAYKTVGTKMVLTPRMGPDQAVTVDLNVEDVRSYQPEDGVPLGLNDKGQPVIATEFAVSKLDATVTVPMGQAVLASGVQTKSKTDHARTLIVMTARVIQ
jgi:type II secretory pathway component GspD/PulD (secretin)